MLVWPIALGSLVCAGIGCVCGPRVGISARLSERVQVSRKVLQRCDSPPTAKRAPLPERQPSRPVS